MTRYKDGSYKLSADEMHALLMVAWEGKERYKELGLNSLAEKYGEAINYIRVRDNFAAVGELNVKL